MGQRGPHRYSFRGLRIPSNCSISNTFPSTRHQHRHLRKWFGNGCRRLQSQLTCTCFSFLSSFKKACLKAQIIMSSIYCIKSNLRPLRRSMSKTLQMGDPQDQSLNTGSAEETTWREIETFPGGGGLTREGEGRGRKYTQRSQSSTRSVTLAPLSPSTGHLWLVKE